ncbi:DUF4244 domain-containing protein [Phytoactinopolyspora limicola]|uniref:DUF4244 domain-containing protein n=1 Tax=Phytoactinopolyspora limicola TaxID=2715536 RepID=UPI001A9CAE83|nr:DUF4244 domain-containing protein [Phytoactinopolyspora limicola]
MGSVLHIHEQRRWTQHRDERAPHRPVSRSQEAFMSTVISRLSRRREAGMSTAEYAVGTVAACGFGGVLYKLLTSEPIQNTLKDVISRAFSLFGG